MKVFLGADHRGFELKEKLKKYIAELDYGVEDYGAFLHDKNDDYPDFARKVAESVANDPERSRGVLVCGSGVGVAIAANKINDIRAGTAINAEQIKDSVSDEDTNILAISADYISEDQAKKIAKSFLETKFSGEERHIRRINKIKKLEKNG